MDKMEERTRQRILDLANLADAASGRSRGNV